MNSRRRQANALRLSLALCVITLAACDGHGATPNVASGPPPPQAGTLGAVAADRLKGVSQSCFNGSNYENQLTQALLVDISHVASLDAKVAHPYEKNNASALVRFAHVGDTTDALMKDFDDHQNVTSRYIGQTTADQSDIASFIGKSDATLAVNCSALGNLAANGKLGAAISFADLKAAAQASFDSMYNKT